MAKDIKNLLKKHLLSGRSITSLQALDKWNTIRLPVYVRRLREDGFVIKTRFVERNGKHFAKYHL